MVTVLAHNYFQVAEKLKINFEKGLESIEYEFNLGRRLSIIKKSHAQAVATMKKELAAGNLDFDMEKEVDEPTRERAIEHELRLLED